MDRALSLERLTEEVQTIYRSLPEGAEEAIEAYLRNALKSQSTEDRLALLEALVRQFETPSPPPSQEGHPLPEEISRLFSLLFGQRIPKAGLTSPDLLEELAHVLNTLFDTLNEIIRTIDTTLLGKRPELETIRHIIGKQLTAEVPPEPLQQYLSRIQEAFLISHKAFQEAAQTKLGELLEELSPQRFESEPVDRFKIGPLRKAEFFERYKEKFLTLKKWFESGRFREELLREFEKSCQKLYDAKRR
ncbi:MAG: hypothetical protein N3G78_06840 [Desulfobacterota bacterium]|nr:hypothetical protein [Thermodesulfobacteriota bacterium]